MHLDGAFPLLRRKVGQRPGLGLTHAPALREAGHLRCGHVGADGLTSAAISKTGANRKHLIRAAQRDPIKHKVLEARYLAEGMTRELAHDKANELYNYEGMLNEWIAEHKGGSNACIP